MSPMHPVFREFFSGECLCLCDFVLMMREEVIDATHVDIDLCSEVVMVTCATLDMPAWTSCQRSLFTIYRHGDSPFILTITFLVVGFPESEISHLFLIVLIVIYTDTRDHPTHIEMSEFSVLTEFLHAVVDASIFSEIGVSFIEESLYHDSHIFYESRYRSYRISTHDSESVEIREKCFTIEFCEFFEGFP